MSFGTFNVYTRTLRVQTNSPTWVLPEVDKKSTPVIQSSAGRFDVEVSDLVSTEWEK